MSEIVLPNGQPVPPQNYEMVINDITVGKITYILVVNQYKMSQALFALIGLALEDSDLPIIRGFQETMLIIKLIEDLQLVLRTRKMKPTDTINEEFIKVVKDAEKQTLRGDFVYNKVPREQKQIIA